MVITVARGWPGTTTFLEFKDMAATAAMNAEIKAEHDHDDQAKSKSQSRAF